MVLRSVLVIVFVGGVAAGATYLAQRPTLARGDVIAADLLVQNKATLRALDCDPVIPIGTDGARFACRAEFRTGPAKNLEFTMDRSGVIKQVGQHQADEHEQRIDKADPWR